jgi:hypothetical protein
MAYNTHNHWISGLSVIRPGRKTSTLLGPLGRSNLNHWTSLTLPSSVEPESLNVRGCLEGADVQ